MAAPESPPTLQVATMVMEANDSTRPVESVALTRVQDLKEEAMDLGVRLLQLVEEQDASGATVHGP